MINPRRPDILKLKQKLNQGGMAQPQVDRINTRIKFLGGKVPTPAAPAPAPVAPAAAGMAPVATPRQQTRLDFLQNRLKGMRNREDPLANRRPVRDRLIALKQKIGQNPVAPAAPTPEVPVTTTPAAPAPESAPIPPNPTGGPDPTGNPDPTAGYMENLLPQVRGIEPADYKGSELYDWQLNKGMDAMAKYNAARGLRDSRAEDTQVSDFVQQLGATEAKSAREISQLEADRAQRQADRLYGMQRDESLRGERGQDREFNQLYSTLQLMLGQNPMGYGADAAGSMANLTNDLGKYMAGMQEKNFPRYIPSGGGGGGHSAGTFIPPYASKPSTAAGDYADIFGGAASNSNYGSIFADLFASML